MELPGVKDPMDQNKTQFGQPVKKSSTFNLGLEERSRIFLNLVLVYCEVKNFEAAKRLLTKAVGEFQGTVEEVRVLLTQSDLAMKMGDTKKALNILKKI